MKSIESEKFNVEDFEGENMEKIKLELEKLSQDNFLIAHQTEGETANRIVTESSYFSNSGLSGTAGLTNPEELMSTFSEVDKYIDERKKSTHKGASAVVLMIFPKLEIENYLTNSKMQGLNTVDDILIDKFSSGEITQFGLPNRFIYGYYNKGKLIKNNKFNPSF